MNRLMKSVTRAVSAVLLSGALTVAAALPARAQWMGELSSTLMTPLPPRPSFAVRIYDDTKENLAFRHAFVDALRRAGYQTSRTGAYVFSFATSITWKAKRQKELQSERVRRYPVERGEARLPTSRDGNFSDNPETLMFGERRTTPPLIAPRISNTEYDRLDISVTLRERESSRVVWTADLALPLLHEDRERIVRSILGPIIRTIGRNADHEPFEVK
jgi:hypothetical protein